MSREFLLGTHFKKRDFERLVSTGEEFVKMNRSDGFCGDVA